MFKSDGSGRMGRGLLGDAPGLHMGNRGPPAYPHPPPMGASLMGNPPMVNQSMGNHHGKGLLGDAPSDQYRFPPTLAEQNNLPLPQSHAPIYQQPTISLTQQLRKLREMNVSKKIMCPKIYFYKKYDLGTRNLA